MTVMAAHPGRLLWEHHGAPDDVLAAEPRSTGWCAVCQSEQPTVAAAKVVSAKFTDWDKYLGADVRWCIPCAWSHQEQSLRVYGWSIHADGQCVRLDQGRMFALLSDPLDPFTAVTVPLSRHKHLIPRSRFGLLAADDSLLSWGSREAERLRLLAWLRQIGFSEAALTEAAPRWAVISALDTATRRDVLCRWGELLPWRNNPLIMTIGTLASRGQAAAHA